MSHESESHELVIKYDRPLVRRALNRFMMKRIGKLFFAVLLLLLVCFAYIFFTSQWSLSATFMGATLSSALLFLGYVYFARLRASEGFFDNVDDPTVTFIFSADGVITESDLGTSNLKWAVFDEVLKFPDVWLLIYAKSGYMTLPADQLTPDCMEFIEQQLASKD